MSRPDSSQGTGDGPRALRIFRVAEGVSAVVRVLSAVDAVTGFNTHYIDKRSYVCGGDPCKHCRARERRYWKGYLAALGWLEPKRSWLPIVLEVTESLELDMRGRIGRGQDWKLTRDKETPKQRKPVRGELLGSVAWSLIPPAFDFLPVLLNLYHEQKLDLGTPNPMPARIIVELCEGAVPSCAGYIAPEVVPPGTLRSMLQGTGYHLPDANPERNGKH